MEVDYNEVIKISKAILSLKLIWAAIWVNFSCWISITHKINAKNIIKLLNIR